MDVYGRLLCVLLYVRMIMCAMLIYLDMHISIPCLFPKDIGGASHVSQMVHFAFKRKFSKCTHYGGAFVISYMESRFRAYHNIYL
jgi:hypothetical protein